MATMVFQKGTAVLLSQKKESTSLHYKMHGKQDSIQLELQIAAWQASIQLEMQIAAESRPHCPGLQQGIQGGWDSPTVLSPFLTLP